MQAHQTQDLERVRRVLSRDPIATAYMLGDLDPTYAHHCAWWVASEREGGDDVAVLQIYTGLQAPVILTYGASDGIEAILAAGLDELPGRAHVHLSPDHLAVMQTVFGFERLRPMMRMGARPSELHVVTSGPGEGYLPVTRLGHRDTGDIVALSSFYPDSFFEPHQLSSGHYYGVRTTGGQLASVAGVHIVSHADRLAAIGNVVTHPDHRGRGLSTACTAHLSRALVEAGMSLLVLNVQRENVQARKVYENLGFREHCTYLEGFLVRALEAKRPSTGGARG